MNAPLDPRAQRQRRAALAERLLAQAPDHAAELDWDALDAAPPWLALPASALALLEARVGVKLCAPTLRLWIDRARVDAARAAVGAAFFEAVLSGPMSPAVMPSLQRATVEEVAARLRSMGAAVLLAALPVGAVRRAAAALLATPAPLDLAQGAAQEVVAQVCALAGEPA